MDSEEMTNHFIMKLNVKEFSNKKVLKIIEKHNKWIKTNHTEGKCAKLKGVMTETLELKGVNLAGADLSGSLFFITFEECDLRGADMRGSKFGTLLKCNLSGADLGNADLEDAFLCGSILRDTNLSNADLKHAILNGDVTIWEGVADLSNANLSGANLSEAYLSGTDLSNANLSGAILSEAYLNDADLTGVSGLTIKQLSKVKTLYKAKLDPELMKQVKEKYPLLLENVKEGEGEEINACKQAIKTDPDDASAYYDLGNAHFNSGKQIDLINQPIDEIEAKEAIEAYKQAIMINPDFAEAHYSLGAAYHFLNDKDSALKEYKILKNLDPEKADELFDEIYE